MKNRQASVHSCLAFIILLLIAGCSAILSQAQQADSGRKLIERTAAPYPSLARNMGLQGTVKLEVLVLPDGSVKETQIKGGHPVLAQAAVNSVRHWKWGVAQHESHEVIEIKFTPE